MANVGSAKTFGREAAFEIRNADSFYSDGEALEQKQIPSDTCFVRRRMLERKSLLKTMLFKSQYFLTVLSFLLSADDLILWGRGVKTPSNHSSELFSKSERTVQKYIIVGLHTTSQWVQVRILFHQFVARTSFSEPLELSGLASRGMCVWSQLNAINGDRLVLHCLSTTCGCMVESWRADTRSVYSRL